MKSKDRAKERLQKTLAESLEPYKEVLESADIQCDLERKEESGKWTGPPWQNRVMEAISRTKAVAPEASLTLTMEIQRLTNELATTQEQLRQTQLSNDDYRYQLVEMIGQDATEDGEVER